MVAGSRFGGNILWTVRTTHQLTGLWSTQTKVEGIVPKTVWYWDTDRRVVNDSLVELDCTVLYEGNSISKIQIQVATYVFELSVGNCHR